MLNIRRESLFHKLIFQNTVSFGGKNVITPQMAAGEYIRTTYIATKDLLPGDVLLCLDDSFGDVAYSAFFDGEKMTGVFEPEGQIRSISEVHLRP